MPVSVVLPCYNEEGVIEEVIRACYGEIIAKIDDSELIVVDDRSTDNTPAILTRLMNEFPELRIVKPDVNSGHGKAVRLGYEIADKNWIFQIDSDDQFEIKDFWKLYELKNDYNFILGNRKDRQDTYHRIMLSKLISFVDQVIFGVKLYDANCPFRLINNKVHKELIAEIDKEALAPNIMIAILAKKREIKIKEVPVMHRKRKTGKVSIVNWKLICFCFRGLKQLFEFRKNLGRIKN